MCCGAKVAPKTGGPTVQCQDGEKQFAPDAWVIAGKFGLDKCAIPGTGRGGLVTRYDVTRFREQ